MSKKHYEIINPSDKVMVSADDETIAAVAVLALSNGRFGLRREDDTIALPVFLLGGAEQWLLDQKIDDLGAYMTTNALALAECLESAFYGGLRELRAITAATDGLDPAAARDARARYNDAKRTSMNDIGSACLEYAASLRGVAAKAATRG